MAFSTLLFEIVKNKIEFCIVAPDRTTHAARTKINKLGNYMHLLIENSN